MKRYIFTLEETQEIKAARKKNRDKNVEKRLAALEMRAEGKQNKEIREKTGFHTQYITVLVSRYLPGPCNRVRKTVHAALPPLRKKCRNFSPSLLMTVTRKTFFRPFSGITSIMPWKKFNTNFQQNQRSVKSYAYLRFKLHLFGFSFVN